MKTLLNLLLVAVMLLTLGCESSGPTTSDKDLQHMEYRQVVESIGGSTEKKPVLLVDVRTAEQFAKGHLPGAINIPLIDLRPRHPQLAGADTVIVYHEDFKGSYADIAAKKLIGSDIKNIYSYAGGYKDWSTRQAEGPVLVPKE